MNTHRVTAATLNFRSAPNTSATIIAVLRQGTQVRVLEQADGWARATVDGRTGWLSLTYLAPLAGPAPVTAPTPAPVATPALPDTPDLRLRLAAVRIAARYVGGRETGNNAGPLVELMLRALGLGPGNPWCGAFVAWCVAHATTAHDVADPLRAVPNRALVRSYRDAAQRQGWLVDRPAAGDLFGWVNPNGTGHIGFIERVAADGALHTIEGNTNEQGSREGDGVYRRVRRATSAYFFVRYR